MLNRTTRRDAANTSYSITAGGLTDAERALAPSVIFDGRFFEPGDSAFRVTPLNSGGSYDANETMAAVYGMVEYGVTSRARVIAGVRFEDAQLTVKSLLRNTQSNSVAKANVDMLPSVALNYQLTDRQSMRLSASQTLARPEYREITPIVFRDAIGEDTYFGDTTLSRTLIRNYDARWEWYPSAGELISVALFAKRFRDPIERIEVASSGTSQFSWANAEGARNDGVEVELRKGLAGTHRVLAPVTLFTNVTVMRSEIRSGNIVNSASRGTRAMVGQAPYVLNAGATYSSASGHASLTALYNRVGERIHTVGAAPKPDVLEQSRHVLDLSARFPVVGRLAGRADLRNLFDAPFVLRQGTVDREYYRAGRVISVGLSWRQ
jgi:TonB-dependent receptor